MCNSIENKNKYYLVQLKIDYKYQIRSSKPKGKKKDASSLFTLMLQESEYSIETVLNSLMVEARLYHSIPYSLPRSEFTPKIEIYAVYENASTFLAQAFHIDGKFLHVEEALNKLVLVYSSFFEKGKRVEHDGSPA